MLARTATALLAAAAMAAAQTCPTVTKLHERASTLNSGNQNEISGIAISDNLRTPGGEEVVWVLSDSGGPREVVAFGVDTGRRYATLDVSAGVPSGHDMEDLAIGRCFDTVVSPRCIYIGEVGNNGARTGTPGQGGRRTVQLYRFQEPVKLEDQRITDITRIDFQYNQDGITSADCEVVLADELRAEVFVITKWNREDASLTRLFKVPQDGGAGILQLRPESSRNSVLQSNTWTGGDISKNGQQIALRTGGRTYIWRRAVGESVAQALNREPCLNFDKPPSGGQHEAVAFGSDFLLEISEGSNQDVWKTTLNLGSTPTPPVPSPPTPDETFTRVVASTHDAEEREDGGMYLDSSDLELAYDAWNDNDQQKVGVRFVGVPIPQGAEVLSAKLLFTCDENSETDSPRLTIAAQDTNNAGRFTNNDKDISSRGLTSAKVTWSNLGAWSVSRAYRSPEIKRVVQEVVDRDGWRQGNALMIILQQIGSSRSKRTAESLEGNEQGVRLEVTFRAPRGSVRVQQDLEAEAGEARDTGPGAVEDESAASFGATEAAVVGGSCAALLAAALVTVRWRRVRKRDQHDAPSLAVVVKEEASF